MSLKVCPFAVKVGKDMYYCKVLGEVLPNMLGLHTVRYKECEYYRMAISKVERVRTCLARALKLGDDYVEHVLERISKGYKLPDECRPGSEACESCPCYKSGFCVFLMEEVIATESPVEVEPVPINGSRRRKVPGILFLRGRRHK